MMNRIVFTILLVCLLLAGNGFQVMAQQKNGYVVAASKEIRTDADWMNVVNALVKRHKATVVYYENGLGDILEQLRNLTPRYLAVVDKPERLNREFVMEGHRLSRKIDNDIYADYIWSIITGYTAEDAMRMVEKSAKPFVIRTALNTTGELSDGKYFERFAYMSDGGEPGGWGERGLADSVTRSYQINKWEILSKWVEKYKEIDPDLLVTSSHATEKNLEMPFTVGNLKPQGGRLYADFISPEFLEGTQHPRVYFAAGNCLIGNINNDPESMAVAWLSGMDATAMVGYVVTTWYGRNGWGGLKYWTSNAGRMTLAQAVYLNQQEMLHIEEQWSPQILTINYPFSKMELGERDVFEEEFEAVIGKKPTKDQMGFVHDRDVVVMYGDPAWDVKLKNPQPLGYKVDFKIKGKLCLVTITTNEYFDSTLVKGGKLKQEHVNDIPLAYYFPRRVANPRLADGQSWNVVVAEDFLLVYNCDFEKNKKYTIVLDIDK